MSAVLKTNGECTGCFACSAICPFHAIKIAKKELDAQYPVIDADLCKNCGLCTKVCHQEILCGDSTEKQGYVAISNAEHIRKICASGGVFSSIAYHFIRQGGTVFGANLTFSDGVPQIRHIPIDDVDQLSRISGSLYVQSDAEASFRECKKLLTSGKKVLFGGTSCQVAALYRYLGGKKHPNLYTVDLIDHGVASADLFAGYIEFLQKKYRSKVVDFRFRIKREGKIFYREKITFSNGRVVEIPAMKSAYYFFYLNAETYRESCYVCPYSCADKPADITIGDYFELSRDLPELYRKLQTEYQTNFGVSSAIVHTEQGNALLNDCGQDLFLVPIDSQKIVDSHPQLRQPCQPTALRDRLKTAYERRGYRGVDRFFRSYKIRLMPHRVYQKIKNIYNSITKKGN